MFWGNNLDRFRLDYSPDIFNFSLIILYKSTNIFFGSGEWGVGSGEWGVGKSFPHHHYPIS
ncbi:MAG: hypothetical protein EA343_22620 [Nodularia sp. (in: Bacteria)]|nr:MAG: hypothetical protein EA343_22620 [Nodularia sp. (in: cyanobacteria)]